MSSVSLSFFLTLVDKSRLNLAASMHIVGTLSYVLDIELQSWMSYSSSISMESERIPFIDCFIESNLEAYLYWLFERIMNDMMALYDPVPIKSGPDSVPQIVDYCTKIQGNTTIN